MKEEDTHVKTEYYNSGIGGNTYTSYMYTHKM